MPSVVDTYLAALPDAQRAALARLRRLLLTLVPHAEETIKTRVPAVCYRGKTVAGFGAARDHVAFYVMFGDALTALKAEFAGFDASRRVVRFNPDTPLPATSVRKVVRFRLAEIDAQLDGPPDRHSRGSLRRCRSSTPQRLAIRPCAIDTPPGSAASPPAASARRRQSRRPAGRRGRA